MSQSGVRTSHRRRKIRSTLQATIPAVSWLRSYGRSDLRSDFSAGLIVALLLIPQGMAYALLAGLPPVVGLYAATAPAVVYAFLGDSRHLMVGPVAIVSLLTLEAISEHAPASTPEYLSLAILLMLMTGLLQLGLGLCRAEFILKFISHGVLVGFTSAAATIIALSQVDGLLGIEFESDTHSILTIYDAIRQPIDIHLPTLLIGVGTIMLLVVYREALSRLPSRLVLVLAKFPFPLLLVAAATVVVYLFDLDERGVAIIGDIPRGLPSASVPEFDSHAARELLPGAIVISLIGSLESISITRTIAAREKAKIDSNQELKALGLANIAGSFFSGYPVTGSFSRTAVAYQSGGKTQIAGTVTAGVVVLALFFLTPLFFYLPNAVLAGIIIFSVSGLVNPREIVRYFRIKPIDGWTLGLTFVTTLVLGVEIGILIGVGFSLLVLIWRSAYPRTVEIGYVEDEGVFRDISRYSDAQTYSETIIVRVDAALYFANMNSLEDWLEEAVAERPGLATVILDFTTVSDIDAVAVEAFEHLIRSYRAAGIQILFAGIHGPVYDTLERAGWNREYLRTQYFPTVERALEASNVSIIRQGGWAEATPEEINTAHMPPSND